MNTRNLARFTMLLGILALAAQRTDASMFTFTNSSPITINDFGPATPYPLTITVSGLNVPILDVNVVLNGFSRTFPSDVGVLLVSPTGQKVVLMNDVGGITPVNNVNLTFDDEASSSLSLGGPLTSGIFKPTNLAPTDAFDPPVLTAGPYASSLSAFDGKLPTGTWSLFVKDFQSGDGGSISGGFGLQVTVDEAPGFALLGFALLVGGFVLRKVKPFDNSRTACPQP
ncbi:MAG TPA: hypothetical protein VIB79_20180 [Candidatus Binatia bacterium]|jgi:subtilisin-like proprotein convertase family protein